MLINLIIMSPDVTHLLIFVLFKELRGYSLKVIINALFADLAFIFSYMVTFMKQISPAATIFVISMMYNRFGESQWLNFSGMFRTEFVMFIGVILIYQSPVDYLLHDFEKYSQETDRSVITSTEWVICLVYVFTL